MKTKRICKSIVSLFLVVMMLISMLTVGIVNASAAEADIALTGDNIPNNIRLWLKPNSNWTSDGARFACCFRDSNNNDVWHSAYKDESVGAYWVTTPTTGTYTKLLWCRMKGTDANNNWDTEWNNSGELGYSASYGNCWNVNEGAWTAGGGSWSTITSYYFVYSKDNWNEVSNPFTKKAEGSYQLTLNLTSGNTYQFKIKGDGSDNKWYSNGGTIDKNGAYRWSFTEGLATNCTIKVEETGTYTFTLDTAEEGKYLSVSTPYNESSGGNEGGGGDDSGDTDGTTKYFFGMSGVTLTKIHYYGGTSAIDVEFNEDNFTSVEDDAEFTVSTTEGDQKLKFDIYAVDIPSDATRVKVFYTNGSVSGEQDIELIKDKVILLFERQQILQYDQEVYEYDDGSDTVITGPTKTVYVGVISYISDKNKPKVLFSGGTQEGRASLVSVGQQVKHAVGASYWSNKEQTFNVYKALVPADTTTIKLSKSDDSVTYNTGKILLYFEYGGVYHINVEDYEAPNSEKEKTRSVYVIDNTTDHSLANNDSKMFGIRNNGKPVELEKTVDLLTGRNMWVMNFSEDVVTTDTFVFYRTSVFANTDNVTANTVAGNNNWWGKWDVGERGKKTLLSISSSAASWSSELYQAPAGSMIEYGYGIWVDSKGNGKAADAVMVHKASDSEYHLYLPSYTDLSSLNLYTTYEKLSIKGGYYVSARNLKSGVANTLNLRKGTSTYTLTIGETDYTLKVYKSDNASTMMMDTKRDLYTGTIMNSFSNDTNAWPADTGKPADNDAIALEYKDAIETSGTYTFYNESGKQVNTDAKLKKIKGRGNSTFKASMEIYGKYAYNFNLSEAVALVDGATASKKWCLLANNVDVTMLRNTLIYALADDIGIKYAPETQLVDVYDNGNYLGAYVITEKVEYGEGTLMNDMNSLEEANEAANPSVDDFTTLATTEATYTPAGSSYSYDYKCATDQALTTPSNFDDYNFVLEFELYNRYENEASWFKSKHTGQAVVVKYPEVVNETEMKWIIDMFDKAEAAVYDSPATDLSAIDAAIDVESFVKMYLIQELALNLDSCATSYYIHNDTATNKLVASPVWDYDWAMGSYFKTKYVYDGSSVSSSDYLDNPEQMFAKDKAIKTDNDHSVTNNYNFQAKLAHNEKFWERCQLVYTNFFVSALAKYIDNDYLTAGNSGNDQTDEGILLTEWLPAVIPSMRMNDARWNTVQRDTDGWGTKVTTDYDRYTYNFNSSQNYSSGVSKSYENSVYYLNDWLTKRMNFMSSSEENKGNLNVKDKHYEVDSVSFNYTQSGNNGEVLTISPSANVYKNNVATKTDALVNVYVDGVLVATDDLEGTITINLEGGVHSVYITAAHKEFPELFGKSDTAENINVTIKGTTISLPIYFKSSSSYRYTPTVTVGDVSYDMVIDGDPIAENAVGAQKYYWYKATVNAVYGDSLTLTFTNMLEMNATITIDEVDGLEYYFGVDNLNIGQEVVDLTDWAPEKRNVVKTAVNMIINDPTAAGLATTSFDGNIYVLGDANEDDTLSIMDVTAIQLALVERNKLSETAEKLADFNLDSSISIVDATDIQIYLVHN